MPRIRKRFIDKPSMWSNKGAPVQSASTFAKNADALDASMSETTAKPPTILVVDDDAEIRYSLSRVLSSRKYHVIEAPSGEAGIALVKKGPHPDLVFLDVRMGAMGGIEALQHI